MKRTGVFLAAVIVSVGLAHGARAAVQSDGCLWLPQVDGFEAGPNNTIVIDEVDNTRYSVTFNGICDNADFAEGISFPDSQPMDEFCPGDTLMVGHESCWSNTITQITSN